MKAGEIVTIKLAAVDVEYKGSCDGCFLENSACYEFLEEVDCWGFVFKPAADQQKGSE